MKIFSGVAVTAILTIQTFGDDVKIREKVFLSEGNQIIGIHSATLGTTKYVAFRFQKKLDSKMSKGKGVFEKANFGDSASTYCYKREMDMSEFEKGLVGEWIRNNKTINVSYSCGEIVEEDKRKLFPGFAETNCQCLDFTFNSKDVKPSWMY